VQPRPGKLTLHLYVPTVTECFTMVRGFFRLQSYGIFDHRAMKPNPAFKRSPNGRPPGPVWRYAVHFRQSGPGVLPSGPA
jgi:hypothetical protein